MDTERESITREVGSRIRYARKSRGMSMEELAQAIYKTRSAISKYENGQISVDIATLYDIANALNVSIYDLLHRNTPDINQEYNAEVPAFFRGVSQLYVFLRWPGQPRSMHGYGYIPYGGKQQGRSPHVHEYQGSGPLPGLREQLPRHPDPL